MVKKKMKLPFHHLFMKSTSTTATTTSWPWRPTCGTPKTLSFRAQNHNILNTHQVSSSSLPSSSSSSPSQEQEQDQDQDQEQEAIVFLELGDQDLIEKVVIRGLKSERLFFEPDETSSILHPESDVINNNNTINANHHHEEEEDEDEDDILIRGFEESVVMAVLDSTDPFVDFRRSMQEMVEFSKNQNKDWDFLEELLTCYLRVNGKNNHGYIVGAFIDLLVTLALSSSSSSRPDDHHQDDSYCSSYSSSSSITIGNTNYSFTSPLSFSSSSSTTTTSPCLSILEVLDDDDEIHKPNPSPPPH